MSNKIDPSELHSSTNVLKMFRMEKTKQTLLNLEEKGLIPKAHRIPRGKIETRMWDLSQLPLIGEKYGFMKKPNGRRGPCVIVRKKCVSCLSLRLKGI